MSGQRIGYIRVSTVDQNTERQLDGIKLDKTFTQGNRIMVPLHLCRLRGIIIRVIAL